MKQLLAHKVQFYPTGKQEHQLAHWFGQSRHCYNFFIVNKKNRISNKEISKLFTIQRKELEWLQSVPRTVQSCGIRHDRDLHAALNILRVGMGEIAKAIRPEFPRQGEITHEEINTPGCDFRNKEGLRTVNLGSSRIEGRSLT